MSSTTPDIGHAIRPDRTLKDDASELTWTYDDDESVPFPSGSASVPATMVAGAHRTSTHVPRPSKRALEAASSGSVDIHPRAKRKAPSDPTPHHCVVRKAIIDVDDDSDSVASGRKSSDDGANTEPVTELAEDDYESIKAMADADNLAITHKPRAMRTADIRVIFCHEKGHVHPDTGKVLDGHWCTVCLDDASIKRTSCFLTGSTSTLQMHIARYHVDLYRKHCKGLGIELHSRALFHGPNNSSTNSLSQSSLEGVITREPKAPPSSNAGLLEYIIELIICEDEAFLLIKCGTFRRLLMFCRPSLLEKDIPHRHTLRAEVLRCAHIAEGRVRENMNKVPSKISFTFDAWTSAPGDPYLSLTAHYIDAPADRPDTWELKSEQLLFQEIQGRHKGKNMAEILCQALDKYRLRGKVGWFTSDGAAVNRTTLRALQHSPTTEAGWTARNHNMLCMEHSLHIAVKHFIQTITPCPRKRANNPVTSPEDTFAIDDGGGNDDDDDDSSSGVGMGNSLWKAIALVKQIRRSPQAKAFFHATCVQVKVPPLQLLLWIRTRWGSLFSFLERFIQLRPAISQFILLTDASDDVPNLTNHRSYIDFHLTRGDWEHLEHIRDALREPSNVQQMFSSVHAPTVCFEFLIKRWETMAANPLHEELKDALNEGIKSLRKWYGRVDGTSPAYFICLVLDPNVKDLYFRGKWRRDEYAAGMRLLEDVFDRYYIAPTQVTTETENSVDESSASRPASNYGGAFLLSAVQAFQQQDRATEGPCDELHQYLQSRIESTTNIIGWWGSNTRYPTLKRIARDYLAIQGLATPSECAFSSGGITGCARRNKLQPEIFGCLQLLKSAYRNGHISAKTQAAQHLAAFKFSSDGSDLENGDTMY